MQDACRLFDLFLSSHPLMPLYLGAAAMRIQRSTLLACDDMPEMHSALVNMDLTRGGVTLDMLAAQALAMFRDAPPATLIRKHRWARESWHLIHTVHGSLQA